MEAHWSSNGMPFHLEIVSFFPLRAAAGFSSSFPSFFFFLLKPLTQQMKFLPGQENGCFCKASALEGIIT